MDIKKELNKLFPNLPSNYSFKSLTKEESLLFNCIAYTIDSYDKWIWVNEKDWTWQNVPRILSVNNFKTLYNFYGYEECHSFLYEANYDKIVVYSIQDIPRHACKQHGDIWKSKIGEMPIILIHELSWLVNNNIKDRYAYGDIAFVMKKRIN